LLANASDPAVARRRLADSGEIVDRMVQRIRDISLDLRPPLLDEMGLSAALRGYLEAQAERTGLAIDMAGAEEVPSLSPEVAITAFRVTQEAITNVVRHAGARHVRVDVAGSATGLRISVVDDGKGFDVRATMAGAPSKALGLLGMQERVRLLGGEVQITSEKDRGTRVQLSLPLEVRS
jgi:signal transduction histidine kinase